MAEEFSWERRDSAWSLVAQTDFDVVIIGGGITGAGILLDATMRGLKAVLIEMQDFAAGTSSRSTKLVHGGLRYLKQFEVGLVAEVGRERAIVYENAPHVTTPVWMLLPIIEGGTYGWLASSVGIYVYDRLAGVKHSERRRMLSRNEALEKEPLLRHDGLKGAGYYVEYRTDDARLTLEIIKEAVEQGGVALNYVKVSRLLYADGKICGVGAVNQLTGESKELHARHVVNAAGPWVDEIRDWDGSKRGKTMHLTKGVHIVIDGEKFPLHNSVYFDVPDGRMIFAIPRDGKTYVGTTDTNYVGDLRHPVMTEEDRDYLLSAIKFMFPTVHLTPDDVESSWAGVRPLIHEEGKSPSEISRKDEVFVSESGLITIAGGKLTGYRKMADKVVNLLAGLVASETGHSYSSCRTEEARLSGGKFGGSAQFAAFIEEHVSKGIALGLTPSEAGRLVRHFGSNVGTVLALVDEAVKVADEYGLPLGLALEVLYGLKYELVIKPSDFFIRRSGLLYFDIQTVRQYKTSVTQLMTDVLGWSDVQRSDALDELDARLEETNVHEALLQEV